MNPTQRVRAEASLRAHRLEAVYLIARLQTRPRTHPLSHGLAARVTAIERYFDAEADVAVRAARALAEHNAWVDARAEGADAESIAELDEVHARIGELRAERARLDARLQAELHAFTTTRRVLEIRLSRLEV